MHEVLVNRLEGLSLPRKSVVRLTDRPDMTLDVYRGRKTTTQHNMTKILLKTPYKQKSYPSIVRPWTDLTDSVSWARFFKTNEVVSYRFVKISNDNILNLPIFFC